MSKSSKWTWRVLIAMNLLAWYALSGREPAAEAQQKSTEPFANSVEQRQETIAQLKEINAQLKEQNALLKSGKLRVILEKSE